jgi:hypothetical protein
VLQNLFTALVLLEAYLATICSIFFAEEDLTPSTLFESRPIIYTLQIKPLVISTTENEMKTISSFRIPKRKHITFGAIILLLVGTFEILYHPLGPAGTIRKRNIVLRGTEPLCSELNTEQPPMAENGQWQVEVHDLGLSKMSKIAKLTMNYGKALNPVYKRAIKTHDNHNIRFGYRMDILSQEILDNTWTKHAHILTVLLTALEKPVAERLEWLV